MLHIHEPHAALVPGPRPQPLPAAWPSGHGHSWPPCCPAPLPAPPPAVRSVLPDAASHPVVQTWGKGSLVLGLYSVGRLREDCSTLPTAGPLASFLTSLFPTRPSHSPSTSPTDHTSKVPPTSPHSHVCHPRPGPAISRLDHCGGHPADLPAASPSVPQRQQPASAFKSAEKTLAFPSLNSTSFQMPTHHGMLENDHTEFSGWQLNGECNIFTG